MPGKAVLSYDPHQNANIMTLSKMVGTRPMLLRSDSSGKEPGFCSEIPAAFSSLDESRNSMDFHWNACIRLLNDIEGPQDTLEGVEAVQERLLGYQPKFSTVLKDWSAAFQAFLRKKSTLLDKQGLRAARTLEIGYNFFAILFEIGRFADMRAIEMAYDRSTARFKHIVDLASSIVDSENSDHVGEKQEPGFCLDMNIVAPLYAAAHRCRDPVIRRKAVSVLYAVSRQEGVWDSTLTARVAEKVISIEETDLENVTCAQDVPYWARICGVQVKFDLYGRLGTVTFRRLRSEHQQIRHTIMETISW